MLEISRRERKIILHYPRNTLHHIFIKCKCLLNSYKSNSTTSSKAKIMKMITKKTNQLDNNKIK